MYKEKDSEARAQFWLAEGNASRSAQLTGLGKFMLYEIRVLAFTRIGDGVPSRPPVLERTLDDGGCQHVGEQKDTDELRGSLGCQKPSHPLGQSLFPGMPFPAVGAPFALCPSR